MTMNREPEGKITVVMPTGKRMNAIESIADAIAYNAQAAMSLTKVIENLETPNVSITNSNIQSSGIGISINTEESDKETGVYHWSESGHSKYDYGYPSEIKLEDEEIPEPYVEDYNEEEIEDMINQGMFNEDEVKQINGLYKRKGKRKKGK